MNKKYPFDYFEEDAINPARNTNQKRQPEQKEQDGQLAFFKPYNNASQSESDSLNIVRNNNNNGSNNHQQNRGSQFGQQASRLNQQRYNNRQQHSFSPIESLSMDEMYIYSAQIDVVSQDLTSLVADMPTKFEEFIFNYSKEENSDDNKEAFLENIKELKLLCDRATLREKDLYEILDRIDNQGLRFKSIDIEQLKQLLEDTKLALSKLPNMNIIQNSPLLISEYEQLEGRIQALNKEVLRRTIYEKASTTHHAIRPLRSLKSAIYYINRFMSYDEPRLFLYKAVRMLTRLRELANFIIQPQHNLNDTQVQQVLEVIKQGSHEWDSEFLANGSSVWDFGPFDIKKIPLMILAPAHSDNYGGEEEISLSVIPDYLIHQVRILLNNLGLRKKPQFFNNNHHRNNNRFDDHGY
ncbi:MAG: hypothetical protein RLZZ210_963 [Pseudomonadota bacterium]|jgi:hypothetical protein